MTSQVASTRRGPVSGVGLPGRASQVSQPLVGERVPEAEVGFARNPAHAFSVCQNIAHG
jgi:hypothetical protein